MLRIKTMIQLVLILVLSAAHPAAGKDFGSSYEKMKSNALAYQDEFLSRTRQLCRELIRDCEHKALQPGQAVTPAKDLTLYSRKGYRFEPTGTLPAGQSVTIVKRLQGYVMISWQGHGNHLVSERDLGKDHVAACRDRYSQCSSLAGKENSP